MQYVCLLRGINVGGKARVEMPRLKKLFEDLGFEEVQTYINSGNVLFSYDETPHHEAVEDAIKKEFGFHVFALIIDEKKFMSIASAVDASWVNDTEQRTDVMFLWPEIDSKSILQRIAVNPEIETVTYVPGALIWNIGRQNVMRGGGLKLIKTDVYKHMTIRNCNTVRELAKRMLALT